MYAFNSAAIFLPGHPYIESTTVLSDKAVITYEVQLIMKSTKVQTSPIYRSHALKHIPQSTEPRAVLGSKYVMATPTQFVKLSERSLVVLEAALDPPKVLLKRF